MSGSPIRWPTKQICIKYPCAQDLSSSPAGLLRSFTARDHRLGFAGEHLTKLRIFIIYNKLCLFFLAWPP